MHPTQRGHVLVVGAGGGIGAAATACLVARGLDVVAGIHRRPAPSEAVAALRFDVRDGVAVASACAALQAFSVSPSRAAPSEGTHDPFASGSSDAPANAIGAASSIAPAAASTDAAGDAPPRPSPLRAVVYAAGLADLGSVEHAPDDALAALVDVHVLGAARVCRALLPALRAGGGRVVLVGSLSAALPQAHLAAYAAAKAALGAWSDALRAEVAPHGVRVVLIEPGAVRTGLAASLRLRAKDIAADSPYRAAVAARRDRAVRDAARGLAPAAVARAIADAVLGDDPPQRIAIDAHPLRTRLRLIRAAARAVAVPVRGGGR